MLQTPRKQGEARADDDIRRVVEILPREIGSKRVSSDQLRALLTDLGAVVDRFSGFTVWRFGRHDRLVYPAERVADAINEYDVSRISGKGYLRTDSDSPFLEIDLWAGGSLPGWDWLFRLSGPKATVDTTIRLLQDHLERWQSTWHHWFHHRALNWFAVVVLAATFSWSGGTYSAEPNPSLLPRLAVLAYLLAYGIVVLVGADRMAPFIWFYRAGSAIEGRRQWLPRLSVAVALGVLANFLWSLLSR